MNTTKSDVSATGAHLSGAHPAQLSEHTQLPEHAQILEHIPHFGPEVLSEIDYINRHWPNDDRVNVLRVSFFSGEMVSVPIYHQLAPMQTKDRAWTEYGCTSKCPGQSKLCNHFVCRYCHRQKPISKRCTNTHPAMTDGVVYYCHGCMKQYFDEWNLFADVRSTVSNRQATKLVRDLRRTAPLSKRRSRKPKHLEEFQVYL